MPPQDTFTTPTQPTYTPPSSPIPPPPTPPVQPPQIQPASPHHHFVVPIIVLILVLLAFSGVVYAYIQKIGPFTTVAYTEENLFSGLLSKAADIKSSTYTVSGSLAVEERDADAKPYELKNQDIAALAANYANDYKRVQAVSSILNAIEYSQTSQKRFPATLKGAQAQSGYMPADTILDPVTKKEYAYAVTGNGADFSLKMTLETDNAIQELKRYSAYNKETTLTITGKTVEFSKDDLIGYYYISYRLPQPFLVEWTDSLRYMPADVTGSISASVSAERKEGALPEWIFNTNAEGTFGDLTYKVNLDALKKDDNYYVKINNIPSLFFFSSLASAKGQWIKFTPPKPKDPNAPYEYTGELGYFQSELPELEKEYKENRDKFARVLREAAAVADETKLASFEGKPKSETVDGRKLTRYDLTLNKSAIIPFYEKLQQRLSGNDDLREFGEFIGDQGTLDYLKSSEFDGVFDYLNQNTQFTLWVDEKGYPAIIQEAARLVPPDTAVQLKGKQVKILMKLVLSDINKTVKIEAPKDARPVEELIEEYKKNDPYSDLYNI